MKRPLTLADELAADRERMLSVYRQPLMQAQTAVVQGGEHMRAAIAQLRESNLSHGTTIGAFLVDNGRAAVALSDGKVSMGPRIASLDFRKILPLDSHTVLLMAGSPVLGLLTGRLLRAYIRSYQDLRNGRPMSTDPKKKRLARELLGMFGLAASGILLAPILATYDTYKGRARIFSYSMEGSFNERTDNDARLDGYATGGSGADIHKVIKERRRPAMSIDDGIALAEHLVKDTAEDDSGSGGRAFVYVLDRDGARLVRGGKA